jgi:hypothetical protein
MKKISLLALVAVLAGACTPDLPPVGSSKPPASSTTAGSTTGATTGSTSTASTTGFTSATGSTASTTAGTATTDGTTASSTTGKTTGDTTTAASTTGSTASTSQTHVTKPGDIKNRIFQLRDLKHSTISGGRSDVDAFVADDDIKAEEGLMWVTDKDLKDDQGMIFVMPQSSSQAFWMQNTLIPLDIIYIAEDGKVVNIVHGKPKNETSLPSTGPAKFVLELKDGMAAKLRIAPATKLTIPKDLVYKGTQQPQQGMNFSPSG